MNRTHKKYLKTFILLCIIIIPLFLNPCEGQAPIGYGPEVVYAVIREVSQIEEAQVMSVQPEETKILEIQPIPRTQNDIINDYINAICALYTNVEPELVKSVIYHESRYLPNAQNGDCVGLMQISMRWHTKRAERLGVSDFYDVHGNILLGVDYLSELITEHKDVALVLMMYNMRPDTARGLYSRGEISKYANGVLNKAESYRRGE